MKGKSIKIKKTNPVEVNDSDESLSLSSRLSQLDNTQGNPLNGSDKENEEEMKKMMMLCRWPIQRQGKCLMMRWHFLVLQSIFDLNSQFLGLSFPRLQIMMQLHCLTTITTLKSLQKLHNPPHQNLKGCLTRQVIQVKRRLTRIMNSLHMFPSLLEEVLSSWSLPGWAWYILLMLYYNTHLFCPCKCNAALNAEE